MGVKSGRLICTKVVSLPLCGIDGDDDDSEDKKNQDLNQSYCRFYYYNATSQKTVWHRPQGDFSKSKHKWFH